MGTATGMICWVFSMNVMLWAPRVTFIELCREQSADGRCGVREDTVQGAVRGLVGRVGL